MKYKLLILILFTFAFNNLVFSFSSDFEQRKKLEDTINASVRDSSSKNGTYGEIIRDLQKLNTSNSRAVRCNRTLDTSARALICNCANEAGVEPLAGKVAVQRVVFSRVKSTGFPNSIRSVICERLQFSWMNNGWDQSCNRKIFKRAPYLNTPVVREPILSECYKATAEAALLEFQNNPKKLFALNYASLDPKAYRNYGNSMPEWVKRLKRDPKSEIINAHIFGFANKKLKESVPKKKQSSGVIVYNSIINPIINPIITPIINLLSNEAFATLTETEIINTNRRHKLILDEKIKTILFKKYPKFKIYSFENYSKYVQQLMSKVRDNLPMAIKGDYNGNGLDDDVILLGEIEKTPVAIALLFDEKNNVTPYIAHQFDKGDISPFPSLDVYLVKISKTKIKHSVGKLRDAFQVEKFGGIAFPIHFNGEKFVRNNAKDGFVWNE